MNYDDKLIAEYGYFKHLITEVYPSGFVSVVSDSYDFWGVITEIVPRLKSDIMARDGRVIIRPDSGDPVDIICGTYQDYEPDRSVLTAEQKGLIECLWEIFGGTLTENNYKVLDTHIGAIYGDSITYERAKQIFARLAAKGFASSNIVMGIGSFTYQYVTRDTHGMAMKSTYAVINGIGTPIFKDPKTDNGIKKSAKGLLMVTETNGVYGLVDQVSVDQERYGCLETVFKDGELVKTVTLADIRAITDREFI